MKTETILSAAEIALILGRVRQQRAFRERILRMDADKDVWIASYKAEIIYWEEKAKELEAMVRDLRGFV